jgi:hypothetical protein
METSPQVNTPFKNPVDEKLNEIEIVDPTHPLFGRRFALLSPAATPPRSETILVNYREAMALRIPISATNLAFTQPPRPCKLTFASISDLLALAEHCEVLCQFNPIKSGDGCIQSNKPSSAKRL